MEPPGSVYGLAPGVIIPAALIAVAAIAPVVLVPRSVVVAIVKSFNRFDDAPGRDENESNQ